VKCTTDSVLFILLLIITNKRIMISGFNKMFLTHGIFTTRGKNSNNNNNNVADRSHNIRYSYNFHLSTETRRSSNTGSLSTCDEFVNEMF